jgi:hypothetical protein
MLIREEDYTLSFTPQAVREHFDWDPETANKFTDEELADAAWAMISEESTWMYHFDPMMDRIIEICEQRRPTEASLLRDLGDPADWPI